LPRQITPSEIAKGAVELKSTELQLTEAKERLAERDTDVVDLTQRLKDKTSDLNRVNSNLSEL
jgi:hypothetical protein